MIKINYILFERDLARVVLALDKALKRPQLLPYLRIQIKNDLAKNLSLVTDEEIHNYLEERRNAKSGTGEI